MSIRRFLRILCCAVCLAGSGQAAAGSAWLVVGPWDAKIEGSVGGPESTVVAVVTRLRLTLDLDQPPPFSGGGPIPAIEFPPIVKSVRLEGGELVLKRGGQAQTLSWRGEFSQTNPGFWEGTMAATGAGTEVTATINYRARERTWRVSALEVRVDLAAWGALLLPALLPGNMEWSCGGTARLNGALTWSPAGLDGTMALSIKDGRAGSSDGEIFVEGIEGAMNLVSLARVASAPGQRFTARTAGAGRMRLKNLAVEVTLTGPDRITVQMEAEGFGGRLAVEPFEMDPAAPRWKLGVRADGIEARQILALFPKAPQGTGTLVGQVPLSYADGRLGFGEGRLTLQPGTIGRVRFQNPGLFTQAWSAWLPGRKLLGQIETGQEELLVNELTIALHPAGAPAGHAAEIRLVGVPAEHPRQGPFTFDFNINAPLEGFINLGLQPNMHVGFK